ncbi:hypothetical protein OE766_05460 [Pararhizobium sp. YC-54]|uniref:hypothetical protein n=1 Tax=Pararhizobium sp. YC-54 TaxID=2986920 RepID=UPI0021F6BE30|nr:hypothetical protein [Pararhizobium sp. YC-54]MCV9997687.1 hypothetical protein [Pararhizobium sp. YC-54]
MGAVSSAWNYLNSIPWLEWAKVTFNAWPLALLLIAWMFRKAVRMKILQISRLTRESIDFESQQLNAPRAAAPDLHLDQEPRFETVSVKLPYINTIAESLHKDLASVPEDKKILVLVAKLAEARVAAAFEFVFGLIFGSQIDFLRRLAEGSISRFDAETWYEEGPRKAHEELASWDFSTWATFLINQGLIEQIGGDIVITEPGRNFVIYVDTMKGAFKRSL